MGSQRPGAWAGSVVSIDNRVVMKSVTQERWEKMRTKIRRIVEKVSVVDGYTSRDSEVAITEVKTVPSPVAVQVTDPNESPRTKILEVCPNGMTPFKTLEHIVGFIVYVAQTYTSMVPYLKGTYLILNS